MGLLALGTPLPWTEAKEYADHVRWHGIAQFMNTWDRLKDRSGDELLWGDEVCLSFIPRLPGDPLIHCPRQIEYMVAVFDNEKKDVKLSLRQTEILLKLGAITTELIADAPEGYAILLSCQDSI